MANGLLLKKAQNAITAHDWSTAAKLYKEFLRADESNVEYIQQLGSIYVRAGQDEKAIPYYEKIISLNENNTEAMVSLGGIFRRLKRYEDSVNILHKAQEISADDASINYSLGFTYKEMGAFEDAVDAFESVISRNPNDVLAHNHLGSIHFAKKDYNSAISAFKCGLQVDQNHPILNYNLAHVYEAIKNFPEAVRCYETALKTRPGWREAIRDFSELLIRCQETKQAQELVEQSIKLHPDDVDMLCILGRIYLNQFDYENATKTFKKAEALKNNDINIMVGLSKALEKGMKIEPAMEKIVEAADIAPENLDVCKQYAHVLLSAQRYDKALEIIKKIDSKSDGKDLQILDLYGQYFVCRGDDEAANTYFDKIQKLNHNYKDYMINAADRYIQTGNYEKAEEMADKFVESHPNLPDGYNILGTLNSARGELSKAKEEYEKGISLKNPNIYAVKELEKIHKEMKANQEIYNDTEMPIAVDADFVPQEEGGNLPEEGSLIDNDENTDDQVDALMASGSDEEAELPDVNSLESTPPIEQALTGEDGEFWEDFDDDPNAKKKPPVEEEEPYDENEEDPDLMSMMTPDAVEGAGEDSLESGLSQDDGDFDFGDFEDAPAGGDAITDADSPEAETESPVAAQESENPVGESDSPMFDTASPLSSGSEPGLGRDALSDEDDASSMYDSKPVQKPEPANEAKPSYDLDSDALSAAAAQQMMNDLKNQQKELELQQREFALQQKELANELKDEIKEENEKMIHKAVDDAVEEKLAGYDLKSESAAEPESPVVESESPVAETESPIVEPDDAGIEAESVTADNEPVEVDESAEDDELFPDFGGSSFEAAPEVEEEPAAMTEPDVMPEPETVPEPAPVSEPVIQPETEVQQMAGPEAEVEPEVEIESEPVEETVEDQKIEESEPEVDFNEESESEEFTIDQKEPESDEIPSDDFDLQLYDDDFTDVGFGDELADGEVSDEEISEEEVASSESEEILAEEAALDGLNPGENMIIEEENPVAVAVAEEFTTEPFVTVDELFELGGGYVEVPVSEPESTVDDEYSDENFITADDMLEKIGRILNNDTTAKNYAEELELFKTLRTLAGFLPEKERNSYDCCRMRMVIEYIIQKMSGKPGLLLTAESLIKSGVLGEEYNRQLEDCCDEELSNDLIRHVITDMKKLAQGLEDRELCNALCVSADGILEQIALIDQQVAIF